MIRPFRILIWPEESPTSGPGVFVTALAEEFRRRGFQITSNPLGLWDAALVNLSGRRLRILQRVPGRGRVCFRAAGWYMPDVFRELGRNWTPWYDRVNGETQYALRHADVVVYQSRWSKRSLDSLSKRDWKYHIIWNGTDITRFRPLPMFNPHESRVVTLGSVGKIRHERLSTLARLSRLIDFEHRFVLVGQIVDELRGELEKISNDSVLAQRFQFVGAVPNFELPAWYNRFDCLVHPVPGDPCPNVVVEAMACGIPVVTLGEGGAAEIAADAGINVPGSLTQFGDDKLTEMATAIRLILNSRPLYASRARGRAVAFFNIAYVATQYLDAMGLPPYVPRNGLRRVVDVALTRALRSVAPGYARQAGKKPVVAYVLWDWYMGGMASWIYRLASALRGEYDFHFLATSVDEFDPKFRGVGQCAYTPNFVAMWRYLRFHRPDLVQVACQRWPIDAARAAGVPRVIERTDGTRSCCAVSKDGLDLIVASSYQTADYIRRIAPHTPIEVVYNSIDLYQIDRAPVYRRCSDGSVVIGRACRIGRGKRLDMLIEACALLPKQLPYLLVIVGGESRLKGADKGIVRELREQANQLGVNALFVGELSDPIPEIKGFDIGTCVSDPYNEGIPNSLIESMAAGQPVVATNVDQVSELVRDAYNGLLIPPGDVIALSHALERLLRDPDLRSTLGTNARRTIETRFSMKEAVARYRRIYQELIGK